MQAEKEETAEAGQTLAGGGGNTKWLCVWSAPARTPSQFAGGFGAEGVRLV